MQWKSVLPETMVLFSICKSPLKHVLAPRKTFQINGLCKFPIPNPISIKLSKNSSVICVSFANGEVYIYDLKKLSEFHKLPFTVLTTNDKSPVTITDISPDSSSIITKSENPTRSVLWDIEKNLKIVDLIYSSDSVIVDCVFGRVEAVSHMYNVFAIYNSTTCASYSVVIWNCATYAVKHAVTVPSRLCDSVCASSEGRYVAVGCFQAQSVDVFTSFNLQKLYTCARVGADCSGWYSHFLPLAFSVDKLQHEFDLLCLHAADDGSKFAWLYEPLRYNYSVVWPVSAALVLIVAIFYFVLQFGL